MRRALIVLAEALAHPRHCEAKAAGAGREALVATGKTCREETRFLRSAVDRARVNRTEITTLLSRDDDSPRVR